MQNPPSTIDEVLHRLDQIIDETIQANNYLGIFAYVYRRTTAQIKQAISENRFEDNEQMEKFDVIFANRYIDAYEKFKTQQDIPKSWSTAFLAKNQPLTIIQHLVMGMNAHISFDLGLAAEAIAPKNQIDDLKNDFIIVNHILQTIINEMQERIGKVSRLMFLLDWVGEKSDEKIINFGIVNARQFAWQFALGLSAIDGIAKDALIEQTDLTVSRLNQLVQSPSSRILNYTLRLISFFEVKNIEKIINHLRDDVG